MQNISRKNVRIARKSLFKRLTLLLISASERVLMYETAESIQDDKYGQTLEGFRNSEHFEMGANKAAIPWKTTNRKWVCTKNINKVSNFQRRRNLCYKVC